MLIRLLLYFSIGWMMLIGCSPLLSEANISPNINRVVGGERHGYWILTDSNGRKEAEGFYENGVKNGDWKIFTQDGNFYWQGKMEDGYWVGWWYLTNTKNQIKIDALKFNKWGECIGHRTMRW
ncbi:MAG: hypothetical protein AAF587_27485 [Bacteroidota bacterium]